MAESLFSDPECAPDPDRIAGALGELQSLWLEFERAFTDVIPDGAMEWKFYRDGKSWLCKATRKTKTLFWSNITDEGFTITFYFSDKAEAAVRATSTPPDIIDAFLNGKRYNRIRALTLRPRIQADLDCFRELLSVRRSIS